MAQDRDRFETAHRLVADDVGVPVAKAGVERVPIAREQVADVLQRRDLELVRPPEDHLAVERGQDAVRADDDRTEGHAVLALHDGVQEVPGDVGLADGARAEVHDLGGRRNEGAINNAKQQIDDMIEHFPATLESAGGPLTWYPLPATFVKSCVMPECVQS